MNPNLIHAIVAEHQLELERQAGCCAPAAHHRRLMTPPGLLGRITARHRSSAAPVVCCP